jgi:hypothetical protein
VIPRPGAIFPGVSCVQIAGRSLEGVLPANLLLNNRIRDKVLFATEGIPQRLKPNFLQSI